MGKKYWRRSSVDKNGVRRRGHWVPGKNPAPGCQFWLLGIIGLATTAIGRRAQRRT